MKYKKVMISFEDKQHDLEVLKHAMDVTSKYNGTLTILHINSGHAGYPSRVMRTMEHSYTLEEIEKIVEAIPHEVPTTVELIKTDKIMNTIIDKSKDYDLLVMGHRHVSFIESLFGDSLDERVINSVECDVLTVKQGV